MKTTLTMLANWLGGAAITVVLLFGIRAHADGNVAKYVPYKGTVEKDGVPWTGTMEMEFALYDATSGGNLLWSETHTVSIHNGSFQVLLGGNGGTTPSGATLDTVLDDGDDLYLTITLDPSGAALVMTNRQRFLPVPYAIWSTASTDFAVSSQVLIESTDMVVDATGADGPLIVRDSDSMTLAVDGNDINSDDTAGLNLQAKSKTAVTTGGALNVGGALDVGGSSTLEAVTADGDAALKANTTIGDWYQDTLVVWATTTLWNDVRLGDTNGADKLDVYSTSEFYNDVTLGSGGGDALTVQATSTFNNSVTVGSDSSDKLTVVSDLDASGTWLMTDCPSGYTLEATNLCVTDPRTAAIHVDAMSDCIDEGAHLCRAEEYAYWESVDGPTLFIADASFWMGDVAVSDLEGADDNAFVVFPGTTNNFRGTLGTSLSRNYRCCMGLGR